MIGRSLNALIGTAARSRLESGQSVALRPDRVVIRTARSAGKARIPRRKKGSHVEGRSLHETISSSRNSRLVLNLGKGPVQPWQECLDVCSVDCGAAPDAKTCGCVTVAAEVVADAFFVQ